MPNIDRMKTVDYDGVFTLAAFKSWLIEMGYTTPTSEIVILFAK